ncbi:MAG: hypothetical protein LR011_04035 [Verrucomicrobia bacterium]|nr:hypothetical protein [Verrucomicrobiota bacterium]
MNKIKRVLAALFGAILFGIIVPVIYLVAFDKPPLDGLNGILLLIGSGVAIGAIVGALFPRIFEFFIDVLFDV